MEEGIKNRVILILAILTVIFFIGTVGSCSSARKQQKDLNEERATRFGLEEKITKFTQEKTALGTKLNNLSQELEKEKAEYQVTQKALLQEQLVSQNLKEELQKVTKLKEVLEDELKKALVAGKPETPKK